MSAKAFILFLLLPLLAPAETVHINGQIDQSESNQVLIAPPIDGKCTWFMMDTLYANAEGRFHYSFPLEEPALLFLRSNRNVRYLLVAPGRQYQVFIDTANQEEIIRVEGDNNKLQSLYANLERPGHVQQQAREYVSLSPAEIWNQIEQNREAEMAPFKKLLEEGDMEPSVFELVRADIETYWAAIAGEAFHLKIRKDFSKKTIDSWAEVFQRFPVSAGNRPRSVYWFDYARNYVSSYHATYLAMKEERLDSTSLANLWEQRKWNAYLLAQSEKVLEGAFLEYFKALHIRYEAISNQFYRDLIQLFEDFSSEYPDSPFLPYLEPKIAEIQNYHQIVQGDFPEGVTFVENYDSLHSLSEIRRRFKGRPLFIDVWASWCGPCKREFQHQAELKEILKENGIDLLFISLDREEYHQKWEEMIKYYSLTGKHILAAQELFVDLEKIFSGGEYVQIPWYIIIDREGDIAELRAPPPSSGEKLYKLLETVANQP